MNEKTFKVGQTVKFTVKTRAGVKTGTGKITALPPPNPKRGANRFTVKTEDGATVKPYPSQIK